MAMRRGARLVLNEVVHSPPEVQTFLHAATESADGASESSMTAGLKFDIPPGGDVNVDDGCAAVDFMFVIDNSISMQDQQNALKAAFPEFIDDPSLPRAGI